ncbi:MAG: Ig-like domain repeat protein [Terriglobales bacterium]
MKIVNRVSIAAVLALLLSGFACAQAVFSAVKVPGSSPNTVISINNSGQVVVNTGTTTSNQISIWNRINGSQTLGLIGTNSVGVAINSSSDVVGAGNPGGSTDLQAFFWQPSEGGQWIGFLGGEMSAAKGINDEGAIVGLSYTSANTQHAFLWTLADGMQDLTPDLTSIGGATAEAVNSSNQVVGYYFPNGSSQTLGFTWTQAGGFQNLGASGTLAFAINASGTVVGQSPSASGQKHAFSWTQTGGLQDLGTLGGTVSSALGINTQGWIVGTSLTTLTNGLLHGFLWTPSAGMQDFSSAAGLSPSLQAYSVRVNDFGVIALSTNKGGYLLVPKITAKFKSSANPSVLGQPVTFTATFTSIAGPPPDGDTVQFTAAGYVLGSATIQGGVAQFTTSAIPIGTHAVTANFSGDANYLPTKYNALTQVVNQ